MISALVNSPSLVEAIRSLNGATLTKIIEHVGLEDSLELVAILDTKQLDEVFDEDLWEMNPSQAEAFKAQRFALWLAIIGDLGDSQLVSSIQNMDVDFLVFAFSKHITVFDLDEFTQKIEIHSMNGGSFREIEIALKAVNTFEIDQYFIVDNGSEHWETILQVITTLDSMDRELLDRIFGRLVELSDKFLGDFDEFSEVLSEAQSLAEDVRAARGDRRTAMGHIDPQDAKAFLKLIEVQTLDELLVSNDVDHLVSSYFKNYKTGYQHQQSFSPELINVLEDFKVVATSNKRQLAEQAARTHRIQSHLEYHSKLDPSELDTIRSHFTYLANAVIVGIIGTTSNHAAFDAVNLVYDYCDWGLDFLIMKEGITDIDQIIKKHGIIKLFKIGRKKANRS